MFPQFRICSKHKAEINTKHILCMHASMEYDQYQVHMIMRLVTESGLPLYVLP